MDTDFISTVVNVRMDVEPFLLLPQEMWRLSEQPAGNQAGLSGRDLFHSPHLGEERKFSRRENRPCPGQGSWLEGTRLHSLALLHPCSPFSQRETEARDILVAFLKPAAPK